MRERYALVMQQIKKYPKSFCLQKLIIWLLKGMTGSVTTE